MSAENKCFLITLLWYGTHNRVPTFEASKYKVTNGDFLEFVRSGGYQNRELWTDEGKIE